MMRVLVVSEKPEFRNEVRRAWEQNGRVFLDARDGLAALQRAVEDAPDTVLLDARLEGLGASDLRDRLAGNVLTARLDVRILSCQELAARAIQSELAITSKPPTMLSASG